MKSRHRPFLRRQSVHYAFDTQTRRHESLHTKDKEQALRLVAKQADAIVAKATVSAGKFYVVYPENGGAVSVSGLQSSLPFRWFKPKTGNWAASGKTSGAAWNTRAAEAGPWVLFVGQQRSQRQ